MKEPFYKAVGSEIRAARLSRGWTQTELARRVGMSRPSVVNIELGRQDISLYQFITYARALHVPYPSLIPKELLSNGKPSRQHQRHDPAT